MSPPPQCRPGQMAPFAPPPSVATATLTSDNYTDIVNTNLFGKCVVPKNSCNSTALLVAVYGDHSGQRQSLQTASDL